MLSKEKIQHMKFDVKDESRNVIESTPLFREIKHLKKSMMKNDIKDVVTSGKKHNHLSFQLVNRT